MVEFLLSLDEALFLYLNSFYNPHLDNTMLLLSSELIWIPLYFLLLWKSYKILKIKDFYYFLGGLLLCITLADQVTSRFMKPSFERLRPSHAPHLAGKVHLVKKNTGELYKGGKYGFASSHAANTFALALWFFLFFGHKKGWKWLFAWAGLVSYTRLYLGVHYPLDLLVGAIVGMIISFSLHKFLIYFYKTTNKNKGI